MSLRHVFAPLVLAASSLLACDVETSARLDATMKDDGYSLFLIDNDRQQQTDATFVVSGGTPGATYALMYSPTAPPHAGWFALSPDARQCSSTEGDYCWTSDGAGYLVDRARAAEDGTVVLRHTACGCDADHETRDWYAYYAVMRVDAIKDVGVGSARVHVDATPSRVRRTVQRPSIVQLL